MLKEADFNYVRIYPISWVDIISNQFIFYPRLTKMNEPQRFSLSMGCDVYSSYREKSLVYSAGGKVLTLQKKLSDYKPL